MGGDNQQRLKGLEYRLKGRWGQKTGGSSRRREQESLVSCHLTVINCQLERYKDGGIKRDVPSGRGHEMKRTTILTFFASTLFLVVPLGSSIGNSPPQRAEKNKCPTIEVKGPKKSEAFNPFVYRSRVKDFPRGTRPIFKWSLIGARIIEGQGTDLIKVKPVAPSVTATLMLENAPAGCGSNKASFQTEMTNVLYGLPPSIRFVELSPSSIVRPCSSGTRSETCSTTGNQLQVSADADAPPDAEVFFEWSVTAGRLTGEGRKVTWDLSGVATGTYTVTVTAQYSFAGWTDGHISAGSATLTISECTDCKPISR